MHYSFKNHLKERLENKKEWSNYFLFCLKHWEINEKVSEKYYNDKPLLSIILKSYYLPINIIKSFLNGEPLQGGYFYSKKAHREIDAIINRVQPEWCYGQLIRTAKYINNHKNSIIDYMDAFSKGTERRVTNFPKIIQPIIKREASIIRKYEDYGQ